jgi:hypothetical protein
MGVSNYFIDEKVPGTVKELTKFVYSTKEKGAHDNLILRTVTDLVANQSRHPDEQKRMFENMNIHMGRWPDVKSDSVINIRLDKDTNISYGRDKVHNFPYLDQITGSIASDFKNRPKKEKIIDFSKNAMITRKDRQKAVIKAKLQEIFVKPLVAQATQQVDAKYGDPLSLGEEQLSQRQSDIDNIVTSSLSEEVKNLMENDKLDTETLMMRIKEIAYMRNKMENQYNNGIEFMITCGEEAYRKDVSFKEVYMKPISIPDLSYDLSYRSPFFEDGLWANERNYLSPMEVVQECYHVLKNKDWDTIHRMFTAIPTGGLHGTDADVVYSRLGGANIDQSISYTNQIRGGVVDHASQEFIPAMLDGRNGVLWANAFMNKMGGALAERKMGIPVEYPTWRWTVPAVKVERVVGNKIVEFIRGEHYKKDKMNGDLKVTDTIIPQTFCAKRYGGLIYTDMMPVIGQYTDPYDISNPKLNIYGGVYNNMLNNVKNLSMMDPAKIYQMRFNNIQESIGEAIQSNLGSILVVNKKTFDGSGGPQGFFDMLYKLKTIVSEDEDFSKTDSAANTRSIQMQSGISIPEYTSLAQYYEQMMIKTLRYNPAKMGNSGQYENQANIQASLAAPDRQLGRYYDINLQIRQNTMQALTQAAFIKYIDNKDMLENYLDESLMAHYEENYDELLGTIFEYKVESSVEDIRNLERAKEMLLNYMATGGNFETMTEAIESKDMPSLKEKAKAERLYTERKNMEQRRHEQDLAAKNNASAEKRQTEMLDKQYTLEYEKIDAGKEKAYINSMQMANANDIDQDGKPDQIARDERMREFDEKVHNDQMDIEKEKLEIQKEKVNADIYKADKMSENKKSEKK